MESSGEFSGAAVGGDEAVLIEPLHRVKHCVAIVDYCQITREVLDDYALGVAVDRVAGVEETLYVSHDCPKFLTLSVCEREFSTG